MKKLRMTFTLLRLGRDKTCIFRAYQNLGARDASCVGTSERDDASSRNFLARKYPYPTQEAPERDLSTAPFHLQSPGDIMSG